MNNLVENEVNRCFNCANKPCMNACPLNNDIPSVISLVRNKKFKEAFDVLCKTTVLPSVLPIICPHEKQCKSNCTAKFKENAIDIGSIEAFIGNMAIENDWPFFKIGEKLVNKNIAVIGSGPAGLTASAFLARNGAKVTIFEKNDLPGGLLRYGIPDFRLSKYEVDLAINKILDFKFDEVNNSIIVKNNTTLGKDIFIENLIERFDAILLAFGANVSRPMSIIGEDLFGVLGGNELLECDVKYSKIDLKNKRVFVSGGGNVAMDVARTVKRLGACSVTVIYRRSEDEMPAEIKEIADARSEGIEFLFNTNLIEIHGKTNVSKIECVKTFYDGECVREKLKNIDGSNFRLDADFVIMCIGASTNEDVINSLKLDVDSKGYVKVDCNFKTSNDKVFAVGDLAGVKGTVAWAASSGRKAAEAIVHLLGK